MIRQVSPESLAVAAGAKLILRRSGSMLELMWADGVTAADLPRSHFCCEDRCLGSVSLN